jgi:spore protease
MLAKIRMRLKSNEAESVRRKEKGERIMQGIRSDLAKEAVAFDQKKEIEGVGVYEFKTDDNITVNRVEVKTEKGAQEIGKKIGLYVTVECPELYDKDENLLAKVAHTFADEITKIKESCGKAENILIIGLGNRNVTPDALGPLACEKVFVSRHIKKYLPDMIDSRVADVSAIAPGVLGITGLETAEVIDGIVDKIRPDMIIVIDALASRSISRIGTSIQVSDAGISPGSGIGNKRKAIDRETLGIPVLAIGIPTVVYAYTIASEILLSAAIKSNVGEDQVKNVIGMIQDIEGSDMIVTPKNIDMLIQNSSDLLARSINFSIHKDLSEEEIKRYMS